MSNVNVVTTIENLTSLRQVANTDELQVLLDTVNLTTDKVESLTESIDLLEELIGLPLNRLGTTANTNLIDAINSALEERDLSSLLGEPNMLTTTDRSNIVSAINEINSSKIGRGELSSYMKSFLTSVDQADARAKLAPFTLEQITGLQAALDSKVNTSALTSYQPLSEKGQPNGYATLDGSGKIPSAQMPPMSVSDTFVASSQASMLALTTADKGDVCVRTDIEKNFILAGDGNPTVLSNWIQMATPTAPVQSVAGKTGTISLVIADISGLQTALNDRRLKSVLITMAEVDGLNNALNGKSNNGHGHGIGEISGLQSQLDSKFPYAGGALQGPITGTGGGFTTSGWGSPFKLYKHHAIQWLKGGDAYSYGMGVSGNTWHVFRSDADGTTHAPVYTLYSDASGNLTAAGNITAYSDRNLKTDIVQIEGALATVNKLRGVSFAMKESGQRGIGVIAQEVETVIPEIVQTAAKGPNSRTMIKSVAYGNLAGVFIEAIKELTSEVEKLKAEIAKLKGV